MLYDTRNQYITGQILGILLANERCCYKVMQSLIGGCKPRISPALFAIILISFNVNDQLVNMTIFLFQVSFSDKILRNQNQY